MFYQVLIQVSLLIFFSFVLVKATDLTISSLNRVSRTFKIGTFALTAILMALATSFPELFVSLVSAWENKPNLVLGVVMGSNIANLSLVIGGAALIGGTVPVVGDFLKKDLFYTFLAGALPLLLLFDKYLGFGDGLALLLVYVLYNYALIKDKSKLPQLNEESLSKKILTRLNHRKAKKRLIWLLLGVILIIFSADMVVKIATSLAVFLQVPFLLIGLILVSIGTSLPEFFFEMRAIARRKVAMVFGNLLGSVVANSTLILGLTAIIRPIELNGGLSSYLLATLSFLIIFSFFWLFVKTKRKLERWEGAILILAYTIFVIIEFWQSQVGRF